MSDAQNMPKEIQHDGWWIGVGVTSAGHASKEALRFPGEPKTTEEMRAAFSKRYPEFVELSVFPDNTKADWWIALQSPTAPDPVVRKLVFISGGGNYDCAVGYAKDAIRENGSGRVVVHAVYPRRDDSL
jgi:hypothetical protein